MYWPHAIWHDDYCAEVEIDDPSGTIVALWLDGQLFPLTRQLVFTGSTCDAEARHLTADITSRNYRNREPCETRESLALEIPFRVVGVFRG